MRLRHFPAYHGACRRIDDDTCHQGEAGVVIDKAKRAKDARQAFFPERRELPGAASTRRYASVPEA